MFDECIRSDASHLFFIAWDALKRRLHLFLYEERRFIIFHYFKCCG
jgi:hypothetical protein